MQTAKLGRTGLEISRIGLGAWALGGGGWEWGWGPQEDEDSIAAIRRAHELGVNWIDTAPQYGFGRSEAVVARAVAGLEPRPYVFTKCSQLEGPGGTTEHSLKRDSIRQECTESLDRLDLDVIDLYQIHFPIPDEDLEEGWRALAELKEEGFVRHIGLSNCDVPQLERCEAIAPVESLQPQYSLLDRTAEERILPWCEERGVGVIVYSPMASGLLSGGMTRERARRLPESDWRHEDPRFGGARLDETLRLVGRLREVGERYGVSPGAVAVAWTLRHPAVTAAIVGFRRPGQVDDILPAADLALTDDDVWDLI